MPMSDRPDAAQSVDRVARGCALGLAIDGALQALRIPRHDAVGHQGECARGGDELLGAATAFCRQRLGADLSLQGMDGLAPFEYLVDRTAKVGQREVVAQIDGAQELPERVTSPIDPVAPRSAAQVFKDIACCSP